MRYFIITFGCQMNKSDSERIATVLEKKGYKPAPRKSEADFILVNMCSVRQAAVDRVFGAANEIAKLKVKNPKIKTVLTGCILKKDRRRFSQKFDLILKIKDLLKYRPKYQNNSLAYVPISNGCNNACSYCAVPLTRGRLVCRDHGKIIKEARTAVKQGFKEVWLLGQNANDYHSPADSKVNFAKLLKMINAIPGNFKFLFTSPHPKNFSDELIGTLAGCKKFGQYLNLPVQSGDNKVLKKMNRNYTLKEYRNLVKKIREKMPGIKLSTDVIVGFPGENKTQFQNTAKLLKKIKFNWAYIAKYSPRSGTTAFLLKDNIPLTEKKRREKVLREIVKKYA